MSGTSTPPPRMKPDSREATVIVPGTGLGAHAPTFPPSIATPSSSSLTSGGELGHDAALVDHQHAVAERPDLIELERHEQHAAPGVALLEQPLVHELDRADVEAARGLRGDR